jgi:hypothetical protein
VPIEPFVCERTAINQRVSVKNSDAKLTKNRKKKLRLKIKRKNATALRTVDMMTSSTDAERGRTVTVVDEAGDESGKTSGDITQSPSKTKV